MAAFHRLHASSSSKSLFDELRSTFGWLDREEIEVRQALLDWAVHVVLDERFPQMDPKEFAELEEELEMLEGRAARWEREWLAQGMERGLAQGLAQAAAHERGLLCRQAGRRPDR